MAKVLISFLGTGLASPIDGSPLRVYRKAKYSVDGKLAGESSFVSSVLMDYYQFDHLYLIGTCKSMWEEVYLYYCEKKNLQIDESAYLNLAEFVEAANYKTNSASIDLSIVKSVLGIGSDAIAIPYGLNYEEQIAIFSKIGEAFKKLKSGDEIILDVTHSFRSLPLFATTIINYFRSLGNDEIKFSKIYYGMMDTMREFDNIAPIIDISSAVELQNWTTAAYSFKEYGKGAMLADLLGGDEGKMIKIFSNAVNINYLNEIKIKLTNFQTLANQKFENEFAQWVLPEVLNSFTTRLFKAGNQQYLFQYELSLWHKEKQNYSAAYLVFVESIITYVCEKEDKEWMSLSNRENAKINITNNNVFGLRQIYSKANEPRKNIAHSLNRRVNQIDKDIKQLDALQKKFLSITKKVTNHENNFGESY